ncbi:cysteine desulfurase [Dehalococcoidia bacterium]|nr:cysteine desulfurase [Dehalococcoidia bacterium]
MLDPIIIRKDFPILSREVYGKPLVYLDNAATSQKPQQVIDALVECYHYYNSNVHRGVHALSMEATDHYEAARQKVANFIKASSSRDVVFVRNTTEAINLVANTWAIQNIGPGDKIVTTEMEHHSNLVPWQKVAAQTGATLDFIPVTQEGMLDLSSLEAIVNERTKLVALVHASNFLGTINSVKEIGQHAHRMGAHLLVDGAQSVPHLPVDVVDMDCDFLAFSGHKMMAPPGIGVLYVKPSVLEDMEPFLRGGEMVREVWYDRATWNDIPLRFEAGTPNFADAIALGAAVDYLQDIGMDNVRRHEIEITSYAINALQAVEELEILGPRDPQFRGGLVTFSTSDIHPHDLGTVLDREGVAIRTGHHCVMPMHRKLNLAASARASFYIYNSNDEVDILVQSLKKALAYFRDAIR